MNFFVNLVVSVSNLATMPFNAITELAGIPEDVARALGASEQSIEAFNFGLMMTGIGEVAALPRIRTTIEVAVAAAEARNAAATASQVKKVATSASQVKNVAAAATEVKNVAATATEVKNVAAAATEVKNVAATATEVKNVAAAVTEVKNVAAASPDIALGMQASKAGGGAGQLDRFAEAVKAASMKVWEKLGLYSSSIPDGRFDLVFEQVMNNTVKGGGRIHFDLTGLDVAKALAGDPMERVGRYTAWELQQISGNSTWLKNTRITG